MGGDSLSGQTSLPLSTKVCSKCGKEKPVEDFKYNRCAHCRYLYYKMYRIKGTRHSLPPHIRWLIFWLDSDETRQYWSGGYWTPDIAVAKKYANKNKFEGTQKRLQQRFQHYELQKLELDVREQVPYIYVIRRQSDEHYYHNRKRWARHRSCAYEFTSLGHVQKVVDAIKEPVEIVQEDYDVSRYTSGTESTNNVSRKSVHRTAVFLAKFRADYQERFERAVGKYVLPTPGTTVCAEKSVPETNRH